jgi:hypothetical protein
MTTFPPLLRQCAEMFHSYYTRKYRPFDPVGEFLKPFVTGLNRIRIPTEQNKDEDGQKAMAKSHWRGSCKQIRA